jgi:hypothetical protein
MNKDGKLYFAPGYTFNQFYLASPNVRVQKWRDRINGFYLDSADFMVKTRNPDYAFVVGLICFTAIDAIARIVIGGYSKPRFIKWIRQNINDFKILRRSIAGRVYIEFRCGLVHEARIQKGGQLTYQIRKIIEINKGIISINPERLLDALKQTFNSYINHVLQDERATIELSQKIMEDFKKDIKFVRDEFRCKNCGGTGKDPATDEMCEYCDGTGSDTEGNYDRELERAEDAAYFSNENNLD